MYSKVRKRFPSMDVEVECILISILIRHIDAIGKTGTLVKFYLYKLYEYYA